VLPPSGKRARMRARIAVPIAPLSHARLLVRAGPGALEASSLFSRRYNVCKLFCIQCDADSLS
jgi:hypothetical protein